ncbi:hypothetical protein A2154_01790 [Candidatus Gottesmanbacteria bacterium RBG_16_43_7]|uniref:Uncharacterized protein n=1 Tax=Candidatus Gottesmanbacteria bacterium RBG_16_43_7 TaxID=1798373 RepID=A0A1F5Z9Z2_9BACT|nr:MAG: hypothetical protein A2154_01790 [Candidatus Gottesmanbacteria bacterium RBG_16_43_7]
MTNLFEKPVFKHDLVKVMHTATLRDIGGTLTQDDDPVEFIRGFDDLSISKITQAVIAHDDGMITALDFKKSGISIDGFQVLRSSLIEVLKTRLFLPKTDAADIRFGTDFGSSRLFTEYVWERIGKSKDENGQINPTVAREILMAWAWYNGCPNPEVRVTNDNILEKLKIYSRFNFIWGELVDRAAQKDNIRLLVDLANGIDTVPETANFEAQNVPSYFKDKRIVGGFGQDRAYLIVKAYWDRLDTLTSKNNDFWTIYTGLSDILEDSIAQSNSLSELQTDVVGKLESYNK